MVVTLLMGELLRRRDDWVGQPTNHEPT